jgi:Fungal Zn(2)-Cys(6) binuclear cluster domain
MVRTVSALMSNRIHQLSASRGRKIRCDGAKPKCYHCSRREGNKDCTYDTLPKRRGPDRTQRARTSGKMQETDGGPSTRRRRRGPITVDQAGSVSDGITQQPRVTAKPSILDTLEDSTPFVHPQQYDVCIHSLDPGFELLESIAGFSTADPRSLSQMLTVDYASTGHAVSRPFLPSGYS